ncbi:MAG: polysaccharide biosynthesis protein [Candidatus Yanofskybacteria bacterium]|nr:polysaccharide biosynthesis protein [Candidatus Yanofskybacteria bacterium]
MDDIIKDKIILVTGGTGSIGSVLVRELLKYKPKQIRVLSRNETKQYELLEALRYPKNLSMLIGDVRDRDRLQLALRDVNIVFHAAALKHVPFCEYNPSEAMKTNVIGSHNIIDAALHNGVERIIAISTDKVANPKNVLGVSKLMMEKLFINSNFFLADKIKLACVRFGNVAWASGSVLPMWKIQAEKSKAINVTNKNATRFLMSIKQAVSLTLKATVLCRGGETFILKMPSISLNDLAGIFTKKYYPRKKIKIKYIGDRAGDKLHEDLLGLNDWNSEVWANDEMFILVPELPIHNLVIEPRSYESFKRILPSEGFSSQDHVDVKAIQKIV